MNKIKVKYRSWYKAISPKQIKLQIPGWAGKNKKHENGCEAQPWHCPPFVEASTYGHELIYPFESQCLVKKINGKLIFEGDFSNENWNIDEKGDVVVGNNEKRKSAPMMSFANNHYGMTSCLDFEPPEGYVTRTEPHPRFYTDDTGTVPCLVAGHIQRWWSRIFFVVFKSPREGEVHVFNKGDPYGQVLFVPQKSDVVFEQFSQKEIIERENRDRKISSYSKKIATNVWKDNKNLTFDNKYKILSLSYSKGGYEEVDEKIKEKISKKSIVNMKTKIPKRLFKKNEILRHKKK